MLLLCGLSTHMSVRHHLQPPMLAVGYASSSIARAKPTRCRSGHFDNTLQSILEKAKTLGPRSAVASCIGDLNEIFMPQLNARISAAETSKSGDLAQLREVARAMEEIYSPATDDEEVDEVEQAHWQCVDEALDAHWQASDGMIDEEEAALVDASAGAETFAFERPSTYGEVTRAGARQLFKAMGLRRARNAVFADVGSGAGRLVAQAWLEMPSLRALGVELAPSRHAAAERAWASVLQSGAAEAFELDRPGGGPEYRLASMLEADFSTVTHIYVASLCMPCELMDAFWERLMSSAPELQCVATLRPFRADGAAAALSHVSHVETTWDSDGSSTELFIYWLSSNKECGTVRKS